MHSHVIQEFISGNSNPLISEPHRLSHLGFVVPDMKRAMRMWEKTSEVIVPPTRDPIQRVDCALLMFANCVPIELVAPIVGDERSPVLNRLSKGGGLDHICLFVENVEQVYLNQKSYGGVGVVDPVYGCVFDRVIAFLTLRTGLVLELMSTTRVGKIEDDPLGEFGNDGNSGVVTLTPDQ